MLRRANAANVAAPQPPHLCGEARRVTAVTRLAYLSKIPEVTRHERRGTRRSLALWLVLPALCLSGSPRGECDEASGEYTRLVAISE